MGESFDLILLLGLAGSIGLWLKLSRARENAIAEARHQCDLHGLQLLDETVGMRGIRLRQYQGERVLERCYGFEVSVEGDDRQQGRLWMVGVRLSGLSLPGPRQAPPADELAALPPGSNVVPLRRRSDAPPG